MSFINSTENYGLPIYAPTDKPSWMVDISGAFRQIDATMRANKDSAEAAVDKATKVGETVSQLASRVASAETAVQAVSNNISGVATLAGEASDKADQASVDTAALKALLEDATTIDSGFVTLPNGLKIAWGKSSVRYINASVCGSNVSIVNAGFTDAPTVVATIAQTGNSSTELTQNVKIANTGNTNFAIYVHGGAFTSATSIPVNWVAIGK